MGSDQSENRYAPGLTLASFTACILALLVASVFVQLSEVLVTMQFPAEHTLAVPAVIAFLAMSLGSAVVYAVSKTRLFTRAELLCVLFALLIACPLMTQGFWHRILTITATIPMEQEFEKIDALSDKLWPHGPNLLDGLFGEEGRSRIQTQGNCTWRDVRSDDGRMEKLPVLENRRRDDVSALRVRLPLVWDGRPYLVAGDPHLVTVLSRAEGLSPSAHLYMRVYKDQDKDPSLEIFRSRNGAKVTFLHPQGFVREGAFGVIFPPETTHHVVLEIGLQGKGTVTLRDPKVMNVEALFYAYKGKRLIRESDYKALPPGARSGLVVKPDQMLSLKGLAYLVSGFISYRQWFEPLACWFAFFMLVLTATFCVGVIMRRQWAESERYPMPMTRIPLALLGESSDDARALPAIWRSRVMWVGFGLSLCWCLLRAWNFYNPKVPDLNISIPMADYFQDPGYGRMWSGVTFKVSAIFLSLAIFMELTVLLSLVAGYFIFRSQFWILGEMFGFKAYDRGLFSDQQLTGAYIAYALLIVGFARKYLWGVVKTAVSRGEGIDRGEALRYRTAIVVLLLTVAGSFGWARMVGVGGEGIVTLFLFTILVCFVGAKLRAECGTPFGYFAIFNGMIIVSLLGGMERFGASSVLTCLIINFMVFPTVFCIIPGAQFELLELGRRLRVQPRHLVLTALIGVAGGLAVGGWPFLSNAYAMGGENIPYNWSFRTKTWAFHEFNADLNQATARVLSPDGGGVAPETDAAADEGGAAGGGLKSISPKTWAYLVPGGVMLVLTLLRQYFAGFWFHPLGYLAGMTSMMEHIWGSCLVAWAIRFLVLKLGGAVTVRTRLQPLFVGVFLGAIAAQLLLTVHGMWLYHTGGERIFTGMP